MKSLGDFQLVLVGDSEEAGKRDDSPFSNVKANSVLSWRERR
jgi:hypothetical protein